MRSTIPLPEICCGSPPSSFLKILKHGSGSTTILIPGFEQVTQMGHPQHRGCSIGTLQKDSHFGNLFGKAMLASKFLCVLLPVVCVCVKFREVFSENMPYIMSLTKYEAKTEQSTSSRAFTWEYHFSGKQSWTQVIANVNLACPAALLCWEGVPCFHRPTPWFPMAAFSAASVNFESSFKRQPKVLL